MQPLNKNLTNELGQLIAHDNAVLFVGTALRKELGERSALEQVAAALAAHSGYRGADCTFASVAEHYQQRMGRHSLIIALREEEEKLADQPAPIHQLIANCVLQQPGTKVITTRFDHLLEQALQQVRKSYMTIVGEPDVPFFDESKVILIKMRGDIDRPDSLVLTDDDMIDFLHNLPTVNDVVRALFATKTLVFLGYDLNDLQFKHFFRQVSPDVARYRRRAYAIVSYEAPAAELGYWQGQNVEVCAQELIPFLEDLARAVGQAIDRPHRQEARLPTPAIALPARPYKALESFGAEDLQIFKGRFFETLRLTNRILSHPHQPTIVYGESGSGKTSLLQAAVGPELRGRQCLFARCVPEPEQPLSTLLLQALAEAGQPFGLQPSGDSLCDTMRDWQQEIEGSLVLAIDQFEQVFLTYNAQQRQETGRLLRDLLCDRSLDMRLVLALREDFLGRLETLSDIVPALMSVRFRLERLEREAARVAIEEPASLFGITWEPGLVDHLLDDLVEGVTMGVSPPQLQIVCDRLYEAVAAQTPDDAKQITSALFQSLGGTEAILGDFLDREVAQFPADQQPLVWLLLGLMVGSSRVKQRISLDELARAADMDSDAAASILDRLTCQRLLQRHEVPLNGHDQVRLDYELTHDYLVARIANRSSEGFRAKQKAWEIVRQALLEWQEWSILPAPDDLRLIAAQLSEARLSGAEAAMLYAAAVCHGEDPAPWQGMVAEDDKARLLLTLLAREDPYVRSQAARYLAAFSGGEIGAALARVACADPDPEVRSAATAAVAAMLEQGAADGGRAAMASLVTAASDPATKDGGQQALEAVWDLEPAAQELVPRSLRKSLHLGVWKRRWLRSRYEIVTATLRGAQGGFWGLGLSLGPVLGVVAFLSASGSSNRRTDIFAMLLAISLVGAFGSLIGGLNAVGWAASGHLGDRPRPWATWSVMTPVSALVTSAGFVLFYYVGLQGWGLAAVASAGLIVGLGLVGAATAPLKLPIRAHLVLAILVGMCTFVLIGFIGETRFKTGPMLLGPDDDVSPLAATVAVEA